MLQQAQDLQLAPCSLLCQAALGDLLLGADPGRGGVIVRGLRGRTRRRGRGRRVVGQRCCRCRRCLRNLIPVDLGRHERPLPLDITAPLNEAQGVQWIRNPARQVAFCQAQVLRPADQPFEVGNLVAVHTLHLRLQALCLDLELAEPRLRVLRHLAHLRVHLRDLTHDLRLAIARRIEHRVLLLFLGSDAQRSRLHVPHLLATLVQTLLALRHLLLVLVERILDCLL
mmetsp:Transcript_131754/g.281715  ORF Transcript_131754/g.281715 Transcript_131754/m.281715 type:complete len:227 (-) Transcript_131754:1084-1764(-)